MENQIEIINDFRKNAPVDIEGLIQRLGISLSKDFLDPDIAGMIEKTKGGDYAITINGKDSETRQRFTMAHELGHFILHRNRIGDGINDNKMYRATKTSANSRIGQIQEIQANQFAANVLMPMPLIKDLQSQGLDNETMAKKLKVSKQALAIRLSA